MSSMEVMQVIYVIVWVDYYLQVDNYYDFLIQ